MPQCRYEKPQPRKKLGPEEKPTLVLLLSPGTGTLAMSIISDPTSSVQCNGETAAISIAPPAPLLIVTIEGESKSIDPQLLCGDEYGGVGQGAEFHFWLDTGSQRTLQVVKFHAQQFLSWTEDQQAALFCLLPQVVAQCSFQLDLDPVEYQNPYLALKANRPPADNHELVASWLRNSIRAIGVFCPESADQEAVTIQNAEKQLNLVSTPLRSIKRQVHEIEQENKPKPDPVKRAMEKFFATLYQKGETGPKLFFFLGEHWFREDDCWHKVSEELLRCRVGQCLQGSAGENSVDRGFLDNVMLNIRIRTLLDPGNISMPFWIGNEGEQAGKFLKLRLLAFRNGLVDLEALDTPYCMPLLPHSPYWFSAIQLDYDYEPAAQCPLWLKTLAEILPVREAGDHRIEVLQEMMGSTLLEGTKAFDKLLILFGEGANGKSTVLNILRALLGAANCSSVSLDQFSSEFFLERMQNKLANIGSDLTHVDKIDEGRLKALTSADTIVVNRKFKEPIEMLPTAKLFFACNTLPQFGDRSGGIWRRCIFMPFMESFEETADHGLSAKLEAELPGIFLWALAGTRRYLAQNSRFTRCDVCEAVGAELRQESDSVKMFLEARVRMTDCCPASVDAVYASYKDYCLESGVKSLGKPTFGRQIRKLPGVSKPKIQEGGRRQYFYTGLGLRVDVCHNHQATLQRRADRFYGQPSEAPT